MNLEEPLECCGSQNGLGWRVNCRWGNEEISRSLTENGEEKRERLLEGDVQMREMVWIVFQRVHWCAPCHSHLLCTQWISPHTLGDLAWFQPTQLDKTHTLLWDKTSLWNQIDNGSKLRLLSSKWTCLGIRQKDPDVLLQNQFILPLHLSWKTPRNALPTPWAESDRPPPL